MPTEFLTKNKYQSDKRISGYTNFKHHLTLIIYELYTQVGSPAVRLRLARCTAWVKRWSEAMDFFQTIFKTNISLSGIFENYIIKG